MPVDSILEVDSIFSRERMIFGEEAVAKIRQMVAGEVIHRLSTGCPQHIHRLWTACPQLMHISTCYPQVVSCG